MDSWPQGKVSKYSADFPVPMPLTVWVRDFLSAVVSHQATLLSDNILGSHPGNQFVMMANKLFGRLLENYVNGHLSSAYSSLQGETVLCQPWILHHPS